MVNGKQNDIKDGVRQHYANRARQAAQLTVLTSSEATSCSDGTMDTAMDKSLGAYPNIYTPEDLTDIPLNSIVSSAGCGNPIALAGLKLGERVLDLGSGGGIDCFLAAKQVGSLGYVIGLDMTLDMLTLARRSARKFGIANVEFIEGFIEDIPLQNDYVDVVISNCVLCLSPDKYAVASESFRVLRSGGRLHISDIMALGPMPQLSRENEQQWAVCTSGAEEEETYLEHLRSAGYVDIQIQQDGIPRRQEGDMPDIVSVKVVAYKP